MAVGNGSGYGLWRWGICGFGYTGGEWYYCHRYETAGITNLICELSGVEKGKKGRDALSVFQSFCF